MKNKILSSHPNPKGLSLPETIVAMAVGLLALLVISAFLINTNQLQSFIAEQSEAISTADQASTQFATALRETTDGADGVYALVTAEANTITFYGDIDRDANTEKITYALSGTDILQTVIEPSGTPAEYLPENGTTKTVAHNIVNGTYTQNAVFSYYDVNNALLADPVDVTSVTLVRIHLDVNVDPNKIPDTHTIETFAQLRNLNDNL